MRITIPPEALEAAAKRLYIINLTKIGHPHPEEAWEALPNEAKDGVIKDVGEACLAMLNAWPCFEYRADVAFPAFGYGPAAFILPLPQENSDD